MSKSSSQALPHCGRLLQVKPSNSWQSANSQENGATFCIPRAQQAFVGQGAACPHALSSPALPQLHTKAAHNPPLPLCALSPSTKRALRRSSAEPGQAEQGGARLTGCSATRWHGPRKQLHCRKAAPHEGSRAPQTRPRCCLLAGPIPLYSRARREPGGKARGLGL